MKRIVAFGVLLATMLAVLSCQQEQKIALKANFTADRTQITVGESVTFSDLSDGVPSRWEWAFEGADVETAVMSSPTVTYHQAGTFGVTLTVTRDGVSDTKSVPAMITVSYPGTIVADFVADATTLTDVDEVRFTDLSTGYPQSWEWTLTGQNGHVYTSTDQNPKFNLDADVYTVKLVASNPVTSDTREKRDYLTVIDKSTVSAAFGALCRTTYAGGSVTFQDQTLGEVTGWQWTFEGGTPATSTEQNPVVKYANAGTYKVTLKSSNAYKSDETSIEKFVQVLPAENLVAFYPFDGDSRDYGPFGIHTSRVDIGDGGTLDLNADPHGPYGHSAMYDSESLTKLSYLRAEDSEISAHFNPEGDYSFSLWGKFPETFSTQVTFFTMGRGANAAADGKNGQVIARFQYNPTAGTNNFTFLTRDQLGVNVANWCQYTGKITDGAWHHYTCVSRVSEDGTQRIDAIYIDGVQVVEKSAKNHTVQAYPFIIGTGYAFVKGTDNYQYQDRYLGHIDDLIVFNRALGVEEIQTLMTY